MAVPDDRLSGGVTRWEVVKAIAEMVKEEGGVPIIAESSAAGVDTEEVIKACGYDQLRDEGYSVIDLKKQAKKVKIPVPDGKLISELSSWDVVAEADAIITVPVMKTHDQTEVTLGLKNLKGLIGDVQKKEFHSIGVINGVIDIIQTVKPVLNVIDGTFCQQGLGPIFGETVVMDRSVLDRRTAQVAALNNRASSKNLYPPIRKTGGLTGLLALIRTTIP